MQMVYFVASPAKVLYCFSSLATIISEKNASMFAIVNGYYFKVLQGLHMLVKSKVIS